MIFLLPGRTWECPLRDASTPGGGTRPHGALALLRPAARPELRAEHTSSVLDALLFTGHAHALAGRPAAALDMIGRYTVELDRRQALRFAERGTNFTGWVLRNLAGPTEAVERHQEALEISARIGSPELRIAALEDLAEDRLAAGDLEMAERHLSKVAAALHGDLDLGWRPQFKLDLLRTRSALARQDPHDAIGRATALATQSADLAVPRYASVARVLVHRARATLGQPITLDDLACDLAAVRQAVAIEAWWWTRLVPVASSERPQ